MKPAILGLSGPALTDEERALLRASRPAGLILFARNITTPDALAALMASLRDIDPGLLLMVDQEGGRVARLRPPHWDAHPAARSHNSDAAAHAGGLAIGRQCRAAGFDIVTAPVLDVPAPDADPIIGDRAFATDPDTVTARAAAFAAGLLAAGIQPVGKHAPGHGRAEVDSHRALPVLERPTESDLTPFRALAARLPWLMTAHVLYRALDPDRPATLSPTIIDRVIRGEIGFDGVLVSDDLGMGALSGSPAARAMAAIEAGCDLALSCDGDLAGNAAVLDALPPITDRARARLDAAARMAAQPP